MYRKSNCKIRIVENANPGFTPLRQGFDYQRIKGMADGLQPTLEDDIRESLTEALEEGTEIVVFGTKYNGRQPGMDNVHLRQGNSDSSHDCDGQDGALLVRQSNIKWTAFYFAFEDQDLDVLL
jgi:hypothetical protein